jgi:hypothetical protein
MKRLFFPALLLLLAFEVANVYFIMPMPGSQVLDSLGWAYGLYDYRWIVRVGLGLLALLGAWPAFRTRPKTSLLAVAALIGITYMANFKLAAEALFRPMQQQRLATAATSAVDLSRLVIGVSLNGEARAYPIQYLGYHHFLYDTLGGQRILVTYCTVCRTGLVFDPRVDGQDLDFRLVGMDHFNAMLEDRSTGSWWRQATGEAVTGPSKGKYMPEITSLQMRLGEWLALYPHSRILQPDPGFAEAYADLSDYENGKRTGHLTRRDSAAWQPKSWVVGVQHGQAYKAYDWGLLTQKRILFDQFAGMPIAVALSPDDQSFAVLRLRDAGHTLTWQGTTLQDSLARYDLLGRSLVPGVPDLQRLRAYQTYWHSWQTFHPATTTGDL